MKLLILSAFAILSIAFFVPNVDAGQGCCSHHGGQSFCGSSGYWICGDGTQSPSCGCYSAPQKTYIQRPDVPKIDIAQFYPQNSELTMIKDENKTLNLKLSNCEQKRTDAETKAKKSDDWNTLLSWFSVITAGLAYYFYKGTN